MSDLCQPSVCISRDDAIDAIGALELRAQDCRDWAETYAIAGDPERGQERMERALRYEAAIERIREAMR